MGLDDLVNKAKDLLGQGEEKAKDAADNAAAGNTEAAAAEPISRPVIDKAKELLTDERIDQVADAIKSKTPDNVDNIVDQVAAKGKESTTDLLTTGGGASTSRRRCFVSSPRRPRQVGTPHQSGRATSRVSSSCSTMPDPVIPASAPVPDPATIEARITVSCPSPIDAPCSSTKLPLVRRAGVPTMRSCAT